MRTIVQAKEPIGALWSTSVSQNDCYRLMKFLVKTKCKEGILLLNTVSGELALLNNEEGRLLESLPKAYESSMDELVTHRFLVPVAYDELSAVLQLRFILRSLNFSNDEIVGYTILPTTVCNARCFYCYESNYPHINMRAQTVELLGNYIESHCSASRKKVHFSWFGGEPTLGERNIDRLCEILKYKGISFSSSMISNGFLFNKELAQKAQREWHLQNIQITLDGTEKIYNKVKAYVASVENPYQRVIKNIGFLLDEKIRVSVRMNLDFHNADNLTELVDELSLRFANNDLFSMYVHEIFEDMGYEPVRRSEDELVQILKKKKMIKSYIKNKGLKQSEKETIKELPFLKTTFCMADNPSSILVNPRGQLGKCQHMQFEHLYGHLYDEKEYNREEFQYWMNYYPMEGCKECPLCPFCGILRTCPSGRSCIPMELDDKMDMVRNYCRELLGTSSR